MDKKRANPVLPHPIKRFHENDAPTVLNRAGTRHPLPTKNNTALLVAPIAASDQPCATTNH